MSHVVSLRLRILSLDALDAGCNALGTIELIRGKTTYHSYQGEMPCEHAIRVGAAKQDEFATKYGGAPYEIGLVKAADGQGWDLMWDSWNQGYGMVDCVGSEARLLKTEYGVAVATAHLESEGYEVERYIDAKTGNVMVRGAREEERRLAGY